MSTRPYRNAIVLLMAAAVVMAAQAPAAGAVTSTELRFSTITTWLNGGAPFVQWTAGLHLDARYAIGAGAFVVTLDPGVLVGASARWVAGLTEAYWQVRQGPFDLRIGVERIPLETARLMLPFSIERVDLLGTRLGRLGARLIWYPNTSTRIRVALLEKSGHLLPAVSLRHEFSSFDIETHVLAFAPGRMAYGIGGSGLLGNLVVYGEAWQLTAPTTSRYALGVTGAIKDGLWVLEAGYAAPLPGAPPRLQLAGQVNYRATETLTVSTTARVFADSDATRGQVVVQISHATARAERSVSVAAFVGPGPLQGVVTTAITVSY